MNYIVIKDKELISRIDSYRVFLINTARVERTRDEVVVNALNKYLHKKSYNSRFHRFKKKNAYRIWENQGGKCYYCKQPMDYKIATLDHKHPIDDCGKMCDVRNLASCCYWCNVDKGRLNEQEYAYKQLANAANGIYPPVPYAGHPDKSLSTGNNSNPSE